MRETTETIGAWAREIFPAYAAQDSRAMALRVVREAVELALTCGADLSTLRSVLRDEWYKAVNRPVLDMDEAAEIGDVLVTLRAMAGNLTPPVDPDAECSLRMARNRARTWGINSDGTGQHVDAGDGR